MSVGPIVATAVISMLIAWAIGSSKGHGGMGFWLGLLLGPLGILIIIVQTPNATVLAQRLEAVEAERAKLRDAAGS